METVKAGKINIPAIKGDTGQAGRIDSISVEMIGTNENPRVDNLGDKSNAKLKFYIPKGTSIENLAIDEFGDLIATLSDGQIIDCGSTKGKKGDKGDVGDDGFSPTITEKINTDAEYILEVTNKEGSFETPNLKQNFLSDLANYYLKSETYSKSEVLELIGKIKTINIQKVAQLPDVGEDNIIYLIPKQGSDNDVHNEFIYIDNKWELIGNTEIDLTEYAKTEYVDNAVENYGVFYWDGKSSDDNPNNIELWQKIIGKAQNQTVIIFSSNEDKLTSIYPTTIYTLEDYRGFFILNPKSVQEAKLTGVLCLLGQACLKAKNPYTNTGPVEHNLIYPGVNISFEENQDIPIVKKVSEMSNQIQKWTTLPTESEQVTGYEPTYDYHPATKKYVDESLSRNNIYSTQEVVIGMWFGKPLYRKVISFGALPNASYKEINHNIKNIERIVNRNLSTNGQSISSPNMTVTTSLIAITTTTNLSGYNDCYVTLEYTKTTDIAASGEGPEAIA